MRRRTHTQQNLDPFRNAPFGADTARGSRVTAFRRLNEKCVIITGERIAVWVGVLIIHRFQSCLCSNYLLNRKGKQLTYSSIYLLLDYEILKGDTYLFFVVLVFYQTDEVGRYLLTTYLLSH